MPISNYLKKNLIFLDLDAKEKTNAMAQIVQLMKKNKAIAHEKEFLKQVLEREKLGSTAIGNNIALPHARSKYASNIIITFARLTHKVDFGEDEEKPVQLVFLMGTPPDSIGEYLKVLAQLSKVLKKEEIRKALLKAQSPSDVIHVFSDAED